MFSLPTFPATATASSVHPLDNLCQDSSTLEKLLSSSANETSSDVLSPCWSSSSSASISPAVSDADSDLSLLSGLVSPPQSPWDLASLFPEAYVSQPSPPFLNFGRLEVSEGLSDLFNLYIDDDLLDSSSSLFSASNLVTPTTDDTNTSSAVLAASLFFSKEQLEFLHSQSYTSTTEMLSNQKHHDHQQNGSTHTTTIHPTIANMLSSSGSCSPTMPTASDTITRQQQHKHSIDMASVLMASSMEDYKEDQSWSAPSSSHNTGSPSPTLASEPYRLPASSQARKDRAQSSWSSSSCSSSSSGSSFSNKMTSPKIYPQRRSTVHKVGSLSPPPASSRNIEYISEAQRQLYERHPPSPQRLAHETEEPTHCNQGHNQVVPQTQQLEQLQLQHTLHHHQPPSHQQQQQQHHHQQQQQQHQQQPYGSHNIHRHNSVHSHSGSPSLPHYTISAEGTRQSIIRNDEGAIMVVDLDQDSISFRCELCPGESFGRIHDLKRHQASKHQDRTWDCEYCHRPFVRRDALLRHYTVKANRNDGIHPAAHEVDALLAARARAKLL